MFGAEFTRLATADATSVSLAIPAGISESGILPSGPRVARPSATPIKLTWTYDSPSVLSMLAIASANS